MMRFTSLTRRQEIGANCYALEADGKQVILDCGMHPREIADQALPDFSLVEDDSVETVIMTHAHQDHIGSLPVLLRRHPRARVFLTRSTRLLGDVMLHNSVNVMLRQREDLGITALPLFTHREVDSQSRRWQTCPIEQRFDLSGERLGSHSAGHASFEFFDAGHILGSTGVLIEAEGKRVFYTGDVNFENQSISRAARFPERDVDVLIMETTRGDSPTPPDWTRAGEVNRLAAALAGAFQRGGCVLIPVFALGKTQELLAIFHDLRQRGLLGHIPIYIGGLSTKLTEIHDKLAHEAPRLLPDLQLLEDVAPFVLSGNEAGVVPIRKGRIYALSSGMMTEKTLSNAFARRILSEPQHSIFFIGYCDPASPGGKLKASKEGDEIQLDASQEPQVRRCKIETFSFSGHSSREGLREYAARLRPKQILLVHGDPSAAEWFKNALSSDLPDTKICIPEPGVPVEI